MAIDYTIDRREVGTNLTEDDLKSIGDIVTNRLTTNLMNKKAEELAERLTRYSYGTKFKIVGNWSESMDEAISLMPTRGGTMYIYIRPQRIVEKSNFPIWEQLDKQTKNNIADAMLEKILSMIQSNLGGKIQHTITAEEERFNLYDCNHPVMDGLSLLIVLEFSRCELEEYTETVTRYRPNCSGE